MGQGDGSRRRLGTPRATRYRLVIAGTIGNALELYDFGVFGYLAPILAARFFPTRDHTAALLQAFGVFAVGYLMRPLGGIVLGHWGDRRGRTWALRRSMFLMAIPTALIGVLPTYAQAGLAAPALLTAVRLLQGMAVGGEMVGTMSLLGEEAEPSRRGLTCSWTTFSAVAGLSLGSGVAALLGYVLTAAQLHEWGWRIPFLLGLVVGLVGLWLRKGIGESESFEAVRARGELARVPLFEVARHDGRAILAATVLSIPVSAGFYLPFVWLPTWLAGTHGHVLPHTLAANTIAMTALLLLIPIGGAAGDRFGLRRVYAAGTAGVVLLAIPVFFELGRGTFGAVLAGQLTLAALSALAVGSTPAILVALFPTRTRYSGLAAGFNGAQALLGGTAPLVATWLIAVSGSNVAPFLYLVTLMSAALLLGLAVEDRHARRLR